MTTMISTLPMDLIEEIISRVPLKSMKAVRLTCKSWNNLSKSESFTRMHFGKAATREEKTMMISMMPHNLYLMSVAVDDADPSIEVKGELSFLHNQVCIYHVLHYEGLLLCILKDVTKIVVWNPYLGQTRWIRPRYSHRPNGRDKFSYALGYEDKESCRSVKFLRFLDYSCRAPDEEQFFWYEIYDFDSGLWTTLDLIPQWWISFSRDGISLKGNTYWPARGRRSISFPDHIICFDFTRERFGPLIPLPSEATDRGYPYVTLSCVEEEKLAALFQHHDSYEYELEVWITTKIEAETVSWSKFLRIDTRPKLNVSISFFIDEEKKVFIGFDRDYPYPKTFMNIIGEARYLRRLDLGVPEGRLVCSYVPSLVQIKKPVGDKRIKQSSIEEHRFAQNMLRLAAFEKPRRIYR